MTEEKEPPAKKNDHKTLITQIVTAAIGGVLLAMQGVNISETNGNGDLIRRLEVGLTRQSELIQQVNQEGARVDHAIKNQEEMLYRLDTLIKNESEMIDLLRKGQSHS
jgi:hypothetical protein